MKCTKGDWGKVQRALEANTRGWETILAGDTLWTGRKGDVTMSVGWSAGDSTIRAVRGCDTVRLCVVRWHVGVDIPAVIAAPEKTVEQRAVEGAYWMTQRVQAPMLAWLLDRLAIVAESGLDNTRCVSLAAAIISHHGVTADDLSDDYGEGCIAEAVHINLLVEACLSSSDCMIALRDLRAWYHANGHGCLIRELARCAR